MTDTLFRCIIIALFFVAFGGLGLLHSENIRLVRARRRTCAVMRRLKRDRDGRQISFEACAEELEDEFCRNVELRAELDAYRDEAKREERVWLN